MNIFDGYCYATITDAANAEISKPVFPQSAGVSVATAFTSTTATAGNLTMTYKPNSSTSASNTLILRTYPTCSQVGYTHNAMGVEVADVALTSWAVFTVWAVVWGLKMLSRTR